MSLHTYFNKLLLLPIDSDSFALYSLLLSLILICFDF